MKINSANYQTISFISLDFGEFWGLNKSPQISNDNIIIYDDNFYYVLLIHEWLTQRKIKGLWHKLTDKNYSSFLAQQRKPMARFNIFQYRNIKETENINFTSLREENQNSKSLWLLSRKRFLRLYQTKNFKIVDVPSITVSY